MSALKTNNPSIPALGSDNGWNTQLTACVVVILASISLGFSAKIMFMPAVVVLMVGLHVLTGFEFKHAPRTSISLLIAIPFALWWRWYPESIGGGFTSGSHRHQFTALLPVMGFYLLTINFYQILAHRYGGNLMMALGSSIFAFTLSGAVSSNPVFIPLSLVLVPLVFFELRNGLTIARISSVKRQMFPAAQVWSILGVIVITIGLQVILIEKIPEIGQWVVNKIGNASNPGTYAGTSRGNTKLGDMSSQSGTGDSEVVARVWSQRDPSYLRGLAHVHYEKGTWEALKEEQDILPTDMQSGRNVFRLNASRPKNVVGTVYPESGMANTVMVPLGTNQIAMFTPRIRRSLAMTILPDAGTMKGGYDYYNVDPGLIQEHGPALRDETIIPPEIEADIKRYADKIIGNEKSPLVMVQKIENYFQNNFTYQIGLKLNTTKDPIVEFMDDIKAGHCEYFATAAALMLRTRGIQTRYITGLSVREQGLGDGYWIARKRDAHAWVEAFIPGTGWTTVEATPSLARPIIGEPSWFSRTSDWFSSYLQVFLRFVVFGGINAVLVILWDGLVLMLAYIPAWGWTVFVLMGVGLFFRKSIIRYIKARNAAAKMYSQRIQSLQARLHKIERALSKHSLRRSPGTPVGDFLVSVQNTPIEEPLKTQALDTLREYQRERFKRE
jgi:hypothetical protein